MMKELDPVDLVHALNEQVDLPTRMTTNQNDTRGGSVSVGPEDHIAGPGCWCGQAHGHDWPGKADGAPHPRYPR